MAGARSEEVRPIKERGLRRPCTALSRCDKCRTTSAVPGVTSAVPGVTSAVPGVTSARCDVCDARSEVSCRVASAKSELAWCSPLQMQPAPKACVQLGVRV